MFHNSVVIFSIIQIFNFANAQQSVGGFAASSSSSQSQTSGQDNDGNDDTDFDQDFPPSPFASQFQRPMQSFFGDMLRGAPWNNAGQMQNFRYNAGILSNSQGHMPHVMIGLDRSATKGIATLNGANSTTRGTIVFTANTSTGVIQITGNITGLPPNSQHGFHIHQYGDLSNGCTSAGSHFNPFNQTHGAPTSQKRHVGDLGNVVADGNGMVNLNMTDSLIALAGPASIIGRAIVVHQLQDDLGAGGNNDSLTTGNAGGRMTCGVIGIMA
ncbi:uncharacterized protein LOC129588044 [Paramacrobiotus metropolitanus]|uniref:uncharacterized protein LOC129588044 n=1 Tax=Paramacrobiotus metropolitanus TaxID=2943436 RepID=UPI002445DC07|nr:uncharacterized protein LOC129588044 [Paramacrobiotus metropolitanus]